MSWKIPSFETQPQLFSLPISSKTIEYESKPFIRIPEKNIAYKQIRGSLNTLLHLSNNNTKFPGNIPVSLLKENLDKLFHRSITYGVLEKTDGCRYLMYITVYKSQVVVALFDRAWQHYWLVDTIVFEKLAIGTVLDVEYLPRLDKKSNKVFHTFYVFDVLAYKGESIIGNKKYHYITRIEIAHLIVKHIIKQIPKKNGIVFQVKNPTPLWELKKLIQVHIPQMSKEKNVPIDGIIFVPLENPYKSGQDLDTFKWKNGNDNTVEFLLRFSHTSEVTEKHKLAFSKIKFTSKKIPVELWVDTNENVPQFYTLTFFDVSRLKELGVEKLLDLDQKIVQCRLIDEIWMIEKIREDKKNPNHIHTVEKTGTEHT